MNGKEEGTPSDTGSEEEYEIEDIVDHRIYHKKLQYLLKWKGYPSSENSWQYEENISGNSLISSYWNNLTNKFLKVKPSNSLSKESKPKNIVQDVSGQHVDSKKQQHNILDFFSRSTINIAKTNNTPQKARTGAVKIEKIISKSNILYVYFIFEGKKEVLDIDHFRSIYMNDLLDFFATRIKFPAK